MVESHIICLWFLYETLEQCGVLLCPHLRHCLHFHLLIVVLFEKDHGHLVRLPRGGAGCNVTLNYQCALCVIVCSICVNFMKISCPSCDRNVPQTDPIYCLFDCTIYV
jgi:hypothetical protein